MAANGVEVSGMESPRSEISAVAGPSLIIMCTMESRSNVSDIVGRFVFEAAKEGLLTQAGS